MTAKTPTPLTSSNKPNRLLFLTHPRSASNLFIRILNLPEQTNLVAREHGGYYFFPAFLAQHESLKAYLKPLSEWTTEERTQIMAAYQKCGDELDADADAAIAQGKVPFAKEHTCFFLEPVAQAKRREGKNPLSDVGEEPWTVKVPERFSSSIGAQLTHSRLNTSPMPDDFLREWHPTFLLRHPALSFPSYRRVSKAPNAKLEAQMSLVWTRALYEFWDAHFKQNRIAGNSSAEIDESAQWPLLLEADDIIIRPAVMQRWCELTGAAETPKLQYKWAPLTDEQKAGLSNVARVMTTTLSGSAGVIAEGKTAESLGLLGSGKEEALEGEVKKWYEEFGEEDGRVVERWVRDALPDYEWLRERRLIA